MRRNHVELTGHLGADPQQRTSAKAVIVTARLAVNNSYTQGGALKERTDWFSLVAFGRVAEALQRFTKGERIAVEGRLQTDVWDGEDGKRHERVEVVVLRVEAAARERADQKQAEDDAPGAATSEPTAEDILF
ncbi:MAG: single-stranded DNA-binding protein [Deltaproteobacteria bacterium]|nr:single-stranded DNA-binding protein [Deltaproteobacteria bacterium]